MSRSDRDLLYELLPNYLRYRDQSRPLDSPLRALMALLERQYDALDEDVERLYDDWFIETCQDWIAPLLGELVGVRGLSDPRAWVPSQRTRIANALNYRRLKGTPAALERIAADVTGWGCLVKVFRDELSLTQSVEHIRQQRGERVDLRDSASLARLGGPFDRGPRLAQISDGAAANGDLAREGRDLAGVGLLLFRLESHRVHGGVPRRVRPGCYTFDPLGYDTPLFAGSRVPDRLTDRVSEVDLPCPLERDLLAHQGAARYGRPGSAIEIFLRTGTGEGSAAPVAMRPDQIAVADLSDWEVSSRRSGGSSSESVILTLDPELGRMRLEDGHEPPQSVSVNYHYGFSSNLGAGPYERESLASRMAAEDTLLELDSEPDPSRHEMSDFSSIQSATQAWPSQPRGLGLIELVDSGTYELPDGFEIPIEPGQSLVLSAASGTRPCLVGDIRVVLGPGETTADLALDGLMIGGRIIVTSADSEAAAADDESAEGGKSEDDAGSPKSSLHLHLRHCTLLQPAGERTAPVIVAEAGDRDWHLDLRAEASILGPIATALRSARLTFTDCILDGGKGVTLSADGQESLAGSVEIIRTTVFGEVRVGQIMASDSIFYSPVVVASRTVGRLRHCYVARDSATPVRERCVRTTSSGPGAGVFPIFTSRTYGQPGYAQLSDRCPPQISRGASDGSEIGAFSGLRNPFRESNLAGILDEYLPWGLEPHIFHVT